jgi:Tfp pilus assembly protein PilX
VIGARRQVGRSGSAPSRRGVAAVVMVVLLMVIGLVIVGMVMRGSRHQDLSVRRLETVQAFYAAEAGMNMAIREMMVGLDEDGDGDIGTISDDGDDGTDPQFGTGRVRVTLSTGGVQSTLVSRGRSGEARRNIEAVLE